MQNIMVRPAILAFPEVVAGRINLDHPKILHPKIRVGFIARDSRTGIPAKQETAITRRHNAQKQIGRCAPVRSIPKLVARSEEHTSELQSHSFISYAVFCLKKK